MKKTLLLLFLLPLVAHGQADKTACMQKTLHRLDQLGSATYFAFIENYMPGDTIPTVLRRYYKEYDNPADTTLGTSFTWCDADDTTRFEYGYDGRVMATAYHEHKGILVDDFTARPLPFRPVSPPFFNLAKNILRYALTTSEHIDTKLTDQGDAYYFRLVIDEEQQVEFFGKAFHMPGTELPDPRSTYEIWIRKSDDLPFKIRREMSHDISVTTAYDVKTGPLPQTALQLSRFYPAGYEIRERAKQKQQPKPEESPLIGKQAPEWTLCDAAGTEVSLCELKGKVVLINFTGIGCGHCHEAIPFLNSLKQELPSEDFDMVAIESWDRKAHSLQVYAERSGLTYPFLAGAETMIKSYLSDAAVPVFILLDSKRIIRRVFRGYSRDMDSQIRNAIEELMQQN